MVDQNAAGETIKEIPDDIAEHSALPDWLDKEYPEEIDATRSRRVSKMEHLLC